MTDHKGHLVYITSSLGQMLGYSQKQLARFDLSKLMPQPFSTLHYKWMKVRAATGCEPRAARGALDCCISPAEHCTPTPTPMQDAGPKPGLGSCRASSTVPMLAANGSQIPVRLAISSKEGAGDKPLHVIAVERSSWDAGLEERRLSVRLDERGVVQELVSSGLRRRGGCMGTVADDRRRFSRGI